MLRKSLVLIVFLVTADAARILGIWMFTSRSHWLPVEPLFQALAARGHEVTVFSPYPQKTPLANYTDIDFSTQQPHRPNKFSVEDIKKLLGSTLSLTNHVHRVHDASCGMLEEKEFRDLVRRKGHFDLLVTELFGTDCFAYFAHLLDVPLVALTPCASMPWASDRVGMPDNPSYVPNNHLVLGPQMSFWQRTMNALVYLVTKYQHQRVFAESTREATSRRLGVELPPVQEAVKRTSLLLLNTYHTLVQSRPFPPNVVEVGGIHIRERKPLPQDLEEIVNNAKHGVIVMSFGSLVRTSTLPKSTILMFLRAFAKMPQTVLFKYEEDLPEAPPNVIVRKWLPQRDLVEHERVVAVVGHGGLHSTIEAVQFGKPLVGVPFFGDQPVNVAAVASRGAGVALDIDALTQADVERALDKVVNDPTYKENMRQLSLQFRDRPMSPLDTAVFWVEYVIRHKGARHLRPASVELPFYQYLLLDVLALVVVTLATIVYLTVLLCRCLYRRLTTRKSTEGALHGKKIN